MSFVHLHVRSHYSFLDGADAPERLVARAAELGLPALALTDRHGVYGAVAFLRAAEAAGVRPILGAEVDADGHPLTLLAEGPEGYAALCRLLTRAHLEHPRRRPNASPEALAEAAASGGLIALAGGRRGEPAARLLRGDRDGARRAAERLRDLFGPRNFYLELVRDLTPGAVATSRALRDLAAALGVGAVATNDVAHAGRDGLPVHDLLVCVRTLTRVSDVHPERPFNAERHLKGAGEMAALFRDCPEAVRNTLEIAERCRPALDLRARRHPAFPLPGGGTAGAALRRLAYEGAARRYGRVTPEVRHRLEHELGVIDRLGFADYFLLVWDVVAFARREGIRCAGRGSAADSAVAYCLGITEVDALGRGLLFERFLSPERAEVPDIDVDFDARHRDRVADYVVARHGREHVAAVATLNTFRARAALRDLGKALEFPEPFLDALAKRVPWHLPADALEAALERYPELRDARIDPGRYRLLLDLCARVAGFPRHLGTHLGGLVISREPLQAVTPLQEAAKGGAVCQFDKDGVEALGMVKLDLLSLRTLSAIEDAVTVRSAAPLPPIPPDDPATYRMIRRGETIGVFQLESPAQRALQPRLRARGLEDLVAAVALIRPGPIQGNMVDPFLRRRHGREPVTHLHPALEPILSKTYGVVLFQEQVIDIARTVAGFTPGEADRLRRVMSHARSRAAMEAIGRDFVAKAGANGVEPEVAERIFEMIAGYASYGFCEAHAAAFAHTAYRTAYLACHHPAAWFAALLNHQPMGYYPPRTLVVEARRRGVRFLPPDVHQSGAGYTLEPPPAPPRAHPTGARPRTDAPAAHTPAAVRVGLRAVRGLRERTVEAILAARAAGAFRSPSDIRRRAGLRRDEAEALVLCGALDALAPPDPATGKPSRRALLWSLASDDGDAPPLPDFPPAERLLREYEVLGFFPGPHPLELQRERLRALGYVNSGEVAAFPDGARVRVAGLAVRPHRPPTKSGRTVVFLSLEDERGLIDVTLFEDLYRRCGALLFSGAVPPLAVEGRVTRRGGGVSLTAEAVRALYTG